MKLIPLVLLITGGLFIYSGINDQNPVTVTKNILTGVPNVKGPNAIGSLGTAGAGVQTQTNSQGVTSQAGTSAGSDAPFNQATTPTGSSSSSSSSSSVGAGITGALKSFASGLLGGTSAVSPTGTPNQWGNVFTPDGNGGFTVTHP